MYVIFLRRGREGETGGKGKREEGRKGKEIEGEGGVKGKAEGKKRGRKGQQQQRPFNGL